MQYNLTFLFIIAQSMKSNADHQDRRNYDDFNEFFWSRNCLRYRYSDDEPINDIEGASVVSGPLPGEYLPPVSHGLEIAPKTFLEKRSWLRGVLALSRVIEWHIVTFYVLGVVAFARELVWGWVFSLQAASAIFWIFNALHLAWALLEVWSSYPGVQLSGTDVCGSIFVLVARFLTLIYQTLYLMWAFSPQKGVYLGIEADSTFWWWQYIWLSLLVMIPYFVEAFLQLVPSWGAKLWMSQNNYVQSFLHILFPLSRLYVGKEVQESFGHVVVYAFFWITMMVWKLFFSYIFEVYSMVQPTLELVDDFLNYPNQSFFKMIVLLFMRWLPQFIVYIIDMSIWYAAWQAFAGTSVGFSDRLGDIRSMDDIRMNFGRAPEHFCKKLLSPDAGSRRGSSASFLGSTNNLAEGQSLLGNGESQKLQSYVNRLMDVRIQKWVMFSAAWNEIVEHFRTEDIVSNQESDNLKFSQFDGLSQAIYLPVFQTAGVINDVLAELERPCEDYKDPRTGAFSDESYFRPISEHVTMQTAVAEVWELGSFLFLQLLGPGHGSDVHAIVGRINKWVEESALTPHLKLENIRDVMGHLVAAINLLEEGIQSRKPMSRPKRNADAKPTPSLQTSKGMRRVVSAGSFITLESPDLKPKEAKAQSTASSHIDSKIIDALRDQLRDKLRNFTHAVKNLLKNTDKERESREVLDRLTFLGSMENGFFWDDSYASSQLDEVSKNITFKAVLKKLHGLVCMHPDDAEPKSKDVRRRLCFFVNTLFMDMPNAPSIHDMFSWNVLTPYYSEDVTYSKGDLQKRTDALGVSTLLYLQTLYRADWNNFMERMGIDNEEKIWSDKFIDETRRWASIRAQTLSRTVHGMMYCEKALRLIASLERLDENSTNDLMGEKFGYIVSCQVYGNMKRNQDPKAEDIEALMHRFPHLRIAYIDSVRLNRSGAATYCSVLIKSDGKGGIQEIYRVRLPGDPVIGEGKPENQNHAMIFTRGEFLQTIDMNQEGYFEEALKMRNCLQEFAKREGPLPTTILGLREHIFTGSVSSLSNYMALQEMSFVTLGQRVLTKPLHMRLHYGHPDVFDKLFFITRGGISKASKGINLSEDIFAGYNNILRGGSVGFKEYVQVGKGRDVGMSQIYKFEAKLSQGAAEQSLSRDVYRMCLRLDFFRLMSFYYGGIGHYFSNVLTVSTVYIVVYLMTVLAIFDLEKIGDRVITPMGTIQMLLGGLGLLQTIPLFATLGVERGWWTSIQEIFLVFVTGGPLHFMFHIQTQATYMAQTILVGGAKYRPTGRGFVTQHTPMDEQYRFFASSHLYLGVELGAGLILMGIYSNAKQYFGRSWSLWLASLSFLASPFWFNPLTLEWSVVCNDYEIWLKWIRGTSGGSPKSWSMWWNEENAFYKGIPLMSKLFFLTKSVLYTLVGEGIRRSSLFKSDIMLDAPTIKIGQVLIFIFALLIIGRLFSSRERSLPYPVRRTIGILLFSGLVAGLITLFVEDTNYIRFSVASYYYAGAICNIGLLWGYKFVKPFYLVHDVVCGHIIFIPLFILAALQLPGLIQTWLLYHNALSTDVVVSDILRYARKSQESGTHGESNEELTEQLQDLRKLVQKQEQILLQAGIITNNGSTYNSGHASVNQPAIAAIPPPPQSSGDGPRPYGRAISMSGMDVWRDMALGDVQATDIPNGIAEIGTGTMTMPTSRPAPQGFSFTQPDAMPPR
jgi:callose synthase